MTSTTTDQAGTETEPEAVRASKRTADLWRSVWRWHFYAGVFVMPVLLTLAVTGLGMLVKPTFERVLFGDRTHVLAQATVAVPYSEQIAKVQREYPGSIVRSITPPPHDGRSTQIDITTAGETDLSVYVNPYDGAVLGAIDNADRFNSVLEQIHGTLWVGTLGDYFVELVAGWTLVLMATGLYLWWPRKGVGLAGAFRVRVRTPGRRRLRDLHATPGAMFAVVVILLVVSGLPWSGFWGKYWGELSDKATGGKNDPETPLSNIAAGTKETAGLQVAWASDRMPVPFSIVPAHTGKVESTDDHYHADPRNPATSESPLALERVAAIGKDAGMLPGFSIGLPDGYTGVFTLSNAWPSVSSDERTMFVDQYSAKVLTDHGWADYGALSKATSLGIQSHMGRQFGPVNAIIMAGACSMVIAAVITSPLMWRKRKAERSAGFPKREPDAKVVRGVLIIAVVLGLLFPLLGASMVAVALFDRLVIRRFSRTRRAFGMS